MSLTAYVSFDTTSILSSSGFQCINVSSYALPDTLEPPYTEIVNSQFRLKNILVNSGTPHVIGMLYHITHFALQRKG